MRKTELRITKAKVRRGKAIERYWCVIVPKLGGGRTRRFFKYTKETEEEVKAEAETFLNLSKVQQQNFGTAALTLSPAQRGEYMEAVEALKPYGITLRDGLALLLPQLKARNRSCTVKDLTAEILRVKKADGASARYLGDLDSRLGHFTESFEERKVATISNVEVDGWLRALRVSATTRNNYRRVLIVAFNFAEKNGYCVSNPAEKCEKAKEIGKPPGILTPTQLARLLENSPDELVPFVAIGAFAGLRTAELERLDWSEVDLQTPSTEKPGKGKSAVKKEFGFITVSASKAKSARRRFVKIHENLAAWLQDHAKTEGPIAPVNLRRIMDAACRKVGFGTPGTETDDEKKAGVNLINWPANALRHSYASYHLAHFKDAAALALEMGHTDSNLVFQHYRELVKPKEGDRYWNIKPAVAENVLAMIA